MEIIDNSYDSSNNQKEIDKNNHPNIKTQKKHYNISTDTTQYTSENEISINDFVNTKIVKQKIDIKNNRYPYCIVWTPLPCISWFLPFIGHTGICG